MSGADSEPKEHASGPEDASNVPTQRRGSCGCGHPDADHDHHLRGGVDNGACRRSKLRGGFGLADQLVVALRRGR
jgi:hypothetical protein